MLRYFVLVAIPYQRQNITVQIASGSLLELVFFYVTGFYFCCMFETNIFPRGPVVRICGFHPQGPGSNPGVEIFCRLVLANAHEGEYDGSK